MTSTEQAGQQSGLARLLMRASSGVLSVRVAGQALMLGLMVFLARVLGARDFSTYVYVLAWLNVGVLLTKMGLDSALLRFVSSYAATEAWGRLRALLRWSNVVVLCLSVGVAGLAALGLWLWAGEGSTTRTALWACAVVPVLSLAALRTAALQGLQRVVRAQIPELVLRPLAHGVLVGAVIFLFERQLGAADAMWLYLVAVSIGFVVGAAWLARAVPPPVRGATIDAEPKAWLTTGVSLLLVSGSFRVITQTDTIMVGALLQETDAGLYYSASRLAQLVNFGVAAVQGVTAPMISTLYAQGERSQLQRLLRLAAVGSAAFAAVATLVLSVFGNLALGLFGPEFTAAYWPLVILCTAQLLSATTGLTGLGLSMTGRHRAAAIIVGTAAVANLGLNAAFIPWLGINGAAVATLCTTVAWNGAAAIHLWRSARLVTVAIPWKTRASSEPPAP